MVRVGGSHLRRKRATFPARCTMCASMATAPTVNSQQSTVNSQQSTINSQTHSIGQSHCIKPLTNSTFNIQHRTEPLHKAAHIYTSNPQQTTTSLNLPCRPQLLLRTTSDPLSGSFPEASTPILSV
jgi:hypothetical protein